MIDELGTYALSDFILFSRETYFGLFGRYNEDLWPAQILALLLGTALLWLVAGRPVGSQRLNRHRGRLASFIVIAACGWTGWAFFLARYLTINPFASYLAVLFFTGAVLFICIGGILGKLQFERPSGPAFIGIALVAFSVFVHPFIGLLAGREWDQLAVFGLAPDPTAVAAMGVALADRRKTHGLLLLPTLLWCIVSTLTAIGLNNIEGIVPAAAGILAVIGSIWKALQHRA